MSTTVLINIMCRYLSLQATSPLGIDNATRCEVEQRICVEAAAPRKDCLEPALRKSWAYLRFVCLPLFLSSQVTIQFFLKFYFIVYSKQYDQVGNDLRSAAEDRQEKTRIVGKTKNYIEIAGPQEQQQQYGILNNTLS